MEKLSGILFILFITTCTAWAQPGQQGKAWERIHAAKVAYVVDRLHISAEQSGSFIPLFDEYEKEIRGIRKSFFQKYRAKDAGPMDGDDMAARKFVDDDLDYQQQIIEVKRKYNDRFLKIITPEQLSDLYTAQREFHQMLMKRLGEEKSRGHEK